MNAVIDTIVEGRSVLFYTDKKIPRDQMKAVRENIDSEVEDPVYYSAPAIVFVIGGGITSGLDGLTMCENMMIAAKSVGIGSCRVYFGQLVLDDPGVREKLEIRKEEKVYGPILLGHPRENLPERAPKKDPLVKWI